MLCNDSNPEALRSHLDCYAGMDMNWVGHNSDQFEQHLLTGQVTVNMNTGAVSGATASGVDERRMRAVLAHGALMLLAFIVFFPLGALTARHKWLAGDKVVGGTWPGTSTCCLLFGQPFQMVAMHGIDFCTCTFQILLYL